MVKVVGKDVSAIHKKTCKNCASVLHYTLSELHTKYGSDYSGDTWTIEGIVCPCCSKFVIHKSYE